ncbi:unnamed protein product [Periconia digitata]|uniref:Enoyl reductase (ER) domain-containing protein n=1 Tax=Periconia digitata TaxID=1303443 RepID=A0A9W4XT12_9PLEO|nr:unnamed protein product [Periconia digitata]
MPSAIEVHSQNYYSWKTGEGAKNLRLNPNVSKPTSIPAGHVLVNIKAASLAPRDAMIISGDRHYPSYIDPNGTPGSDGAGIIEKLGEGADGKWEVGDRVIIAPTSWLKYSYEDGADAFPHVDELKTKGEKNWNGTLREYGVFPASELIPAPSYLSYPALASLPANAGTAAHALFFGPRRLRPGQTVLAQGTGGVSVTAIQIAAAVGATVIATSSSNAKLEIARKLGATHTVNYSETPAWEDEVLRLTDGKGVDVVIEIGGSATLMQSLKATKFNGLVCLVGFLTEPVQYDIIPSVLFTGRSIYGVRSVAQEHVEYGVKVLAEKKIEPAVGKVFDWSEEGVGQALKTLANWEVVGKVVVKVGEE